MKAIGKETLAVEYGSIALPTIPAGATYASFLCEPDGTSANATKAVRYWMTGDDPTPSEGLHLGTLRRSVSIGGAYMLSKIKFTGVESGKTHILQIQYWK